MRLVPGHTAMGASIEDLDLRDPLDDGTRDAILRALGEHGVLCFPGQALDAAAQRRFCAPFGSLEVNIAAAGFLADGLPEVMVLSNELRDGRPIGLADAGQGWHTDMSYSRVIALATVLHALEVPSADGRPLGATRFQDMHAAYQDLPETVRARLAEASAVHDFEKFWEMMRRRKGSTRPPLSAQQRQLKPPVAHPVCMTHPITGRKVLYANPGYVTHIEGMPPPESAAMLAYLFEHQLREEYRHVHHWRVGDVLMWDDIGTLHDAVADYGAHQPRRMHRCQVMADHVLARAMHGPAGEHLLTKIGTAAAPAGDPGAGFHGPSAGRHAGEELERVRRRS
jgi:taurine dioxygenase